MDDLQYPSDIKKRVKRLLRFKPCYKWMTFNTTDFSNSSPWRSTVLNLVINGWPSIHDWVDGEIDLALEGFKPCYKWMTFNTEEIRKGVDMSNGIGFKPCYKWMTFNTT